MKKLGVVNSRLDTTKERPDVREKLSRMYRRQENGQKERGKGICISYI